MVEIRFKNEASRTKGKQRELVRGNHNVLAMRNKEKLQTNSRQNCKVRAKGLDENDQSPSLHLIERFNFQEEEMIKLRLN